MIWEMILITENRASGIVQVGIERDLALFSIPNFQSSIPIASVPIAHSPVNN